MEPFVALVLGMLTHALKQIHSFRRLGGTAGWRQYLDAWPSNLAAVTTSVGFWLGLPELPELFPTLAGQIGLPDHPTVIGSFAVGFIGNSLADGLLGRLRALLPPPPPQEQDDENVNGRDGSSPAGQDDTQ